MWGRVGVIENKREGGRLRGGGAKDGLKGANLFLVPDPHIPVSRKIEPEMWSLTTKRQ